MNVSTNLLIGAPHPPETSTNLLMDSESRSYQRQLTTATTGSTDNSPAARSNEEVVLVSTSHRQPSDISVTTAAATEDVSSSTEGQRSSKDSQRSSADGQRSSTDGQRSSIGDQSSVAADQSSVMVDQNLAAAGQCSVAVDQSSVAVGQNSVAAVSHRLSDQSLSDSLRHYETAAERNALEDGQLMALTSHDLSEGSVAALTAPAARQGEETEITLPSCDHEIDAPAEMSRSTAGELKTSLVVTFTVLKRGMSFIRDKLWLFVLAIVRSAYSIHSFIRYNPPLAL